MAQIWHNEILTVSVNQRVPVAQLDRASVSEADFSYFLIIPNYTKSVVISTFALICTNMHFYSKNISLAQIWHNEILQDYYKIITRLLQIENLKHLLLLPL